MAEITYLIDEMKSQFEKNDSPFEYGNNFGDEDAALGAGSSNDDNMPANLEELKDLMRLYFFLILLYLNQIATL
jgi:hypothetical protein